LDGKRFDYLARALGEQTDRRGMAKAAAGGALALLGLGALGRNAVTAASGGFDGDTCETNADCRKGLRCKGAGRCRYKASCGGKKGDACKNSGDCCNGLRCKNDKCKKKR
jgi:hypothetical protein